MGRRSKNRPPKKKAPQIVVPAFPTLDNCDLDNPEEHLLWMLVGLPGMKGAPLPFPVEYLRVISAHLYACGARFHPELQTIKYRKPTNATPNWLVSPGDWVPMEAPDDPADELSPEARQLLEAVERIKAAKEQKAPPVLPDDDGRVPYIRRDGTTVMVTPAQAARYAAAKRDLKRAKGGRR